MSLPIEPSSVFVLVPAYNESEVIKEVIDGLVSNHYNVVIIDDGSHNPVKNVWQGLPVYLVRHCINLGQGAALQTGIEFALSKSAQFIVTFDADGQHDVFDIDSMLTSLKEGNYDIVMGSRFLDTGKSKVPPKRKLLLKIARIINYLFTGLLLTDAHNGLRLMTAKAAAQIKITENRMAHATEILSIIKRKHLSFKEVPVHIRYTSYSQKKGQTGWNSFRILVDLVLNRFVK